jgi:DNA modification methylase
MEEREMGATILEFKPRESLTEFVKGKSKLSLIRRAGGRKSSQNMAIFGENLAALAGLKAGFGTAQDSLKVDLIVIDPPYNVGGNQGYRNIWKGQSEKERDWAGDHGAFLDFMEPRLKIGRQLLTDAGVIMVNICDGEYCRLKILMDQIFGEENCLGTVIWNQGRAAAAKHLASVHEYVLVYAKNARQAPPLVKEKPSARAILQVVQSYRDSKVPYKAAQTEFDNWLKQAKKDGIISSNETSYCLHPKTLRPFLTTASCAQDNPEGRSHKKLLHPVTKKPCKVPAKGWKWSEETLLKMYEHTSYAVGSDFVVAGQFCFGKDENTVPRKVQYLEDKMDQLFTTMINISHSMGKADLPPGIEFQTPKPISLIKELIKSYPKKDCRVMDYFGGSGTTAAAVVELNNEDGGNRSWILIEEMGSTYHNVMVPRIEYVDKEKDFSTYEVEMVPVGGKELLKKFNQHSFDFLTSYHLLDETESVLVEGMNVVGFDKQKNQLIAITVPNARKSKNFFVEELAAIKQTIKKVNAKSVLIYTLHGDTEEPWLGVDKSVLSGTHCKDLATVGVPDELVKEWNEVLEAMAS